MLMKYINNNRPRALRPWAAGRHIYLLEPPQPSNDLHVWKAPFWRKVTGQEIHMTPKPAQNSFGEDS